MPGGRERRRARRCPSCGGANIMRGMQIEGVQIPLVRATEEGPAVAVPAYSDICGECGMVTLYVRVGEQKKSDA